MNKEVFKILSSNNKTMLNVQKWTPNGKPVGIVQLAHGMAEYIDRYDDFAKYLNTQGFIVIGHDHLGHGDSITDKHDYGYFSEGDATRYLIDDMVLITSSLKEEYPELPYFVFGHSMGSFITRHYITQYSHIIDGAIICGTGQMPKAVLKSGMALTYSMAQKKGWHYRSEAIDKLGFGGFNKSIKNPRTKNDWLSRDKDQVDAYINDERNGFIFTLNGYYHLFDTCLRVQDIDLLNEIRKDLPILLIAGDHDPVGDNGKAVLTVSKQYEDLGIEDVMCILYPEYRHEILNEIDNLVVYEDVNKWLHSKIK